MRARICNRVFAYILRQILVFGVAVEGEQHYLHSGEARFVAQRHNAVVYHAEVLGYKIEVPRGALHSLEQLYPRALPPLADLRRGRACGYGVVSVEPAEVVDAHYVVEFEGALYAVYPPAVAVLFCRAPVIQGVAPQLARRRKVVGRNARNLGGVQIFVQKEHFGVRPHVGRVCRHIQRYVADYLYALGIGVFFELFPLA